MRIFINSISIEKKEKIRKNYNWNTMSFLDISKKYGISRSYACRIVK